MRLGNHPADDKLYSHLGKKLGTFERIARNKGFLLPAAFPVVNEIDEQNSACLIEDW